MHLPDEYMPQSMMMNQFSQPMKMNREKMMMNQFNPPPMMMSMMMPPMMINQSNAPTAALIE